MAKNFDELENSNRSRNPSIHEVSSPARRLWLRDATALVSAGLMPPWLASLGGCAVPGALGASPDAALPSMVDGSPVLGGAQRPGFSFKPIPIGTTDAITVPEGYTAQVLAPWGEPVGIEGRMPAFKPDGSNSAADQAVQMGMHHDGIHFYPFDGSSNHGLLCMNHEYSDDGLLHRDGRRTWSAEKVAKGQAAHGVSVIEVRLIQGRWEMVQPSRYARRHTAATPFEVRGPAAAHALMKTAFDPAGRTVLGTLNNCASGKTPWGTYLSGEENWGFYFNGGENISADQKRWGLRKTGFYRWPEHDERFDAARHPNEFHRFGWIVEIDPMDPAATPIKRTALGRAAHEGAWVALTRDGRAVVYSGEDARFEYIYKFVSRDRVKPAGGGLTAAQANRDLLDHGTLYVARFNADGTGVWMPLVHGQGPLTASNGFADQGEVVIKTRQAADLLGATKMDRPEWLAIDPRSGEVYCTLTNNTVRGSKGMPAADAANPRANNIFGQIIRWKEEGDFHGERFTWNHLVLAGDPANAKPEHQGNIRGDLFACPDGIAFDPLGRLWVQTDAHASQMYKGELARIGSNQMLACDLSTGQMKRFLTGPINCEITGVTWAPDARSMFLNIQHPGESPSDVSDPDDPSRYSTWPHGIKGQRPRSATVVVRRLDGGVIGA